MIMAHEEAKTLVFEGLKNWITEYMKHKDIFLKSIVSIKPKEDGNRGIIIEYKTKKMDILIEPYLSQNEKIFENVKKSNELFDSVSLVVLNTKENLNKILEAWEKLSQLAKLSIYFVNPDSNSDKRWIICPYTHSRITERSSLKTGLKSIFSTVEEVKAP